MATNCLVTIRALSCVRHATRNLSDGGDITTYFSGANIWSEHIDSMGYIFLVFQNICRQRKCWNLLALPDMGALTCVCVCVCVCVLSCSCASQLSACRHVSISAKSVYLNAFVQSVYTSVRALVSPYTCVYGVCVFVCVHLRVCVHARAHVCSLRAPHWPAVWLQTARVELAILLFLPCHLLAHIILGPASIPQS